MNPQYILVLVVIVFMGWFGFGVLFNLRRGEALMKWMQTGLPAIGPRTTLRWLGTSVVELVIAQARKPFRKAEILLVLKPRDVFWMTLLAWLQGRNDLVIVRTVLGAQPLLDLELADPKTWTGRSALRELGARGWDGRPYGEMQLMAPRGLLDLAASTLDRLAEPMQRLAPRYARFRLQKGETRMEIHLPFPDTRRTSAGQYFEALRALGQAAGERV